MVTLQFILGEDSGLFARIKRVGKGQRRGQGQGQGQGEGGGEGIGAGIGARIGARIGKGGDGDGRVEFKKE